MGLRFPTVPTARGKGPSSRASRYLLPNGRRNCETLRQRRERAGRIDDAQNPADIAELQARGGSGGWGVERAQQQGAVWKQGEYRLPVAVNVIDDLARGSTDCGGLQENALRGRAGGLSGPELEVDVGMESTFRSSP